MFAKKTNTITEEVTTTETPEKEDLSQKFKLSEPQHAIAILTMLFQQRGTARSCDENFGEPSSKSIMSVAFVGL